VIRPSLKTGRGKNVVRSTMKRIMDVPGRWLPRLQHVEPHLCCDVT
jgi:hypothetical protein